MSETESDDEFLDAGDGTSAYDFAKPLEGLKRAESSSIDVAHYIHVLGTLDLEIIAQVSANHSI